MFHFAHFNTFAITVKLEKFPLWPMPFLQQLYIICRIFTLYTYKTHTWVINKVINNTYLSRNKPLYHTYVTRDSERVKLFFISI